jgi:copper resistance protein B
VKRRSKSYVCLALLLVSPNAAFAQHGGGGASEAAPFGAPVEDQHVWTHLIADQLEGRFGRDNGFRWSAEAWTGTDSNRFWLKSEGETNDQGKVEEGQHELLYARPITSFFDLQAGLRSDIDSRAGRNWAALGIEGLAPLFFHVSATGYASSAGHYAAKLEGNYDLLLTQQLILQPELELNFYSKSDPARGLGSGLADMDAGLRLRYEFNRKFAPYIGVAYENSFAGTAALVRALGEKPSRLRFTFGLRAWL